MQDLADQNIQDYTRAIVNEWKVGGGDRLGMVLVLDIQGEDYYCVSGTGISEKFSTKVLQELLDQYLEPQFAQGSYDGAVAGFFAEAADRAESWGAEGAFGTKTTQSTAAGEPNWAGLAWIALGLVLIAVSGWKLLAFFKKRPAKAGIPGSAAALPVFVFPRFSAVHWASLAAAYILSRQFSPSVVK